MGQCALCGSLQALGGPPIDSEEQIWIEKAALDVIDRGTVGSCAGIRE